LDGKDHDFSSDKRLSLDSFQMIFAICFLSMFSETFDQAQVDFHNFLGTIYKYNHSDKIVHNDQPFNWQVWEE